MFLQPPIILVVPGSTVPNLVHIDSGEDDDYDNENYGDHTAICRHRLVAMSNLRSPTSYVHIAHDQKNVKPNKTGTTRGRNVGTACTQRHTCTLPADVKANTKIRKRPGEECRQTTKTLDLSLGVGSQFV